MTLTPLRRKAFCAASLTVLSTMTSPSPQAVPGSDLSAAAAGAGASGISMVARRRTSARRPMPTSMTSTIVELQWVRFALLPGRAAEPEDGPQPLDIHLRQVLGDEIVG